MAITVDFESPIGTPTSTRQFQPGAELRIGGHVTGILGLGEPFLPITIDIEPENEEFSPLFDQVYTNLIGYYHSDLILPNVTARANLIVTAQFPIETGPEQVTIPISIGDIAPNPLPKSTLKTILIWAGIAAVVGIGVYALSKTQIIRLSSKVLTR